LARLFVLFGLEAVDFTEFCTQIRDIRARVDLLARHALHQFLREVAPPMLVDVLAQPAEQRIEPALRDLVRD